MFFPVARRTDALPEECVSCSRLKLKSCADGSAMVNADRREEEEIEEKSSVAKIEDAAASRNPQVLATIRTKSK